MTVRNKLNLDPHKIRQARAAAASIADDVTSYVVRHTTVARERTVLRLFGVDGIDADGVPLPNVVVEQAKEKGLLGDGITRSFVQTMLRHNLSPQALAESIAAGEVELTLDATEEQQPGESAWLTAAYALAEDALHQIRLHRQQRESVIAEVGDTPTPYLYVIVATGNIYEDIIQARAAARQGADIIAVIRSTGQSLLDYVPYGATTEGFGGTYATQENFRLMRQALDDVGTQLGRYIRLCNYASGLCMPEIAAMGALERLDVMLNDALYGILFRDINMQRTLIDQHFSRMINAYAGIIINTGEDNYLTTADAVEAAHTVLASQFINEQLALRAGLPPQQMGLGHAFEMDPDLEDGFLLEVAQAQMAREIFPDAPLKYMPPTKHMTGNIFRGHVQDALFNMVGIMTGQGIQLLGMMTEAIHTPLIHERQLAIEAARYIFNNARHIGDEIEFRQNGRIVQRAHQVLDEAVTLLDEVQQKGMFTALSEGIFADVKRSPIGGRGLSGVIKRTERYENPIEVLLQRALTGHEEVAR